jgi:hypothetical protein
MDRMIVTPDLVVMSRDVPALPGKSSQFNDSVKDPGIIWDADRLTSFYKETFDTKTILNSVVDQVAQAGIPWVDP